jgi:transcription termination/antitermination protein NusG
LRKRLDGSRKRHYKHLHGQLFFPTFQADFLGRISMYDSRWQVVHVVANHEKRVAQHLASRCVEHFLPLYSEKSRRTDRAVLLERPLFTGYIFVRPSIADRLPLISAPGVLRLLGDNDLHTVSEREISAIREALEKGYPLRPHPALAVGTPVRVCHGVFDGVMGVVTELRRKCNVVIRVAAVEQCFSLELPCEDLEVMNRFAARATGSLAPAISAA